MVLDVSDRLKLIAPFSLEKIKTDVFSMEHNMAHGPDDFPIELFQIFVIVFLLICLLSFKILMLVN